MAFNIFENEAIMAEFDRIAAEPIDNEPYSLVHNPKPVVESVVDFNGNKIDMGSWCSGDGVDENKKKVGKAKTATDPKLTKKASTEKTGEKKDDGKLVENVDAKEKKDGGKTTEVKTNTEVKVDKAPKAGSGSSFDSAAKSAATDNRKGAADNKKFADGAKLQKSIDLFKKSVRALATDTKSAADAEKVLKKFDKMSSYLKPKTESIEWGDELSNATQKPRSYEIRKDFFKRFFNEYRDVYQKIIQCASDIQLVWDKDMPSKIVVYAGLNPKKKVAETCFEPGKPDTLKTVFYNSPSPVIDNIVHYDNADIKQAIIHIAKEWAEIRRNQ